MVSEFYQPLDPEGTYFVAPNVSFQTLPVYLYQGATTLPATRFNSGLVGLAVGTQFKEYGELRVGLVGGSLKPTLETGAPYSGPGQQANRPGGGQ